MLGFVSFNSLLGGVVFLATSRDPIRWAGRSRSLSGPVAGDPDQHDTERERQESDRERDPKNDDHE